MGFVLCFPDFNKSVVLVAYEKSETEYGY